MNDIPKATISSPAGLRRHRRRLQRLLARQLRAFDVIQRNRNELLLRLDTEQRYQLFTRLLEIDRSLAAIAHSPLGPTVVESALGITARERLRWTRDGRLRQQGQAFLQRGQLIGYATYFAARIDELLNDPALIERWRAQDLQSGYKKSQEAALGSSLR